MKAAFDRSKTFPTEDGAVALFYSTSLPEIQLRKIKTGSVQVGWLIPTNSIESSNFNWIENTAFQKAGECALRILENCPEYSGATSISDAAGSDTAIVLIDKKHIDITTNSDQDALVVGLFEHGFVVANSSSQPSTGKLLETLRQNQIDPDSPRTLRLRLGKNSRVRQFAELINKYITKQPDPFAQFYFLYQFVEQQIHDERKERIQRLPNSVASVGHNYSEVLDVLEKFKSETKELDTLRKIFGGGEKDFEHIAAICARSLGIDPPTDAAKLLYKIRNSLFHGLSIHGTSAEPHMIDVIAALVPMLVSTVEKP